MTPQQIYDKVCAHLAKQGHKAIGKRGGCVYRAENGDKCAAGCLIPDERYDPEMEYNTISYVLGKYSMPKFMNKNTDLIEALQDCHDGSLGVDRLRKLLRDVAAEYSLNVGAEQAIKTWN
jgi:hypothetical protein